MTKKLKGEVTFRQNSRLGQIFAEQVKNDYEINIYSLAKLISGAIYHYHLRQKEPLSKQQASEWISDPIQFPKKYKQALDNYLAKEINEETLDGDSQNDSVLDLMRKHKEEDQEEDGE